MKYLPELLEKRPDSGASDQNSTNKRQKKNLSILSI